MIDFPISFNEVPYFILGLLRQANTGIIFSDNITKTQYRMRAYGVDNRDYAQSHYMMVIGL